MTDDTTTNLAPELVQVIDFLRQILPFNQLSEPLLQRAAGALTASYHVHGESFDINTQPMGLRIVRRGAADIRDHDNKLLDRLGEGESFHIGGLNAEKGDVTAIIIEDALLYFLPDEAYRSLRSADRNFDRYFSGQRSRRLRRAARHQPDPNSMMRELGGIMSTNLLSVSQETSIQATAAAMAKRRVSSAFVVAGEELLGIVTDRDLRERCVAKALSVEQPIASIMTPTPHTIDSSARLVDAMLYMTQKGCHHLPVTSDGKLAGIVTTSDLILARQDDPVYLVRHLTRQPDAEAMVATLQGVPNLVVQWVKSGIPAHEISHILTAISDAVTVRLIQLAEAELGPAPTTWVWTSFGSQARGEQLLGADQDNGMIIANDYTPEPGDWFAQMATRVSDGLALCGFKYCPGKIMATTDEWRQPLQQWQHTVDRWTRAPTPDAVMRVSIFFDLRAIYGNFKLVEQLQQTMLDKASSNTIFQAALAANALDSSPPLGIFRRFVVDRNGDHRDELDLKKRGVLPITELTRLHALAAKLPQVNTAERLHALSDAKKMSLVNSRNLQDALHCIQQQRLNHQCELILAGEPSSNYINPKDLPKLAKEQLRDAFTIIDEAQTALRLQFRGGLN